MSGDRLIYLPLGGAGEIGMNAYLYGYGPEGRERFMLVDLGVTFPDMDTTPGVDLILPDISWLEERKDRLDGIVITHAHEDHVGAVGHLWPRLQAPIYARNFTAHIARMKMEEHGLDTAVIKTLDAFPQEATVGPFKIAFLPVSHSIPESSSIVIDTPAGRIIHTGDFKIDATPIVGEPFDPTLWAEAAAPGVKALVCDSTNVFSPNPGRSEATLGSEIEKLVAGAPGLVAATTFASNVARVKTLAEAGDRAGRSIVLMGRAMKKMVGAALDTGVMTEFPQVISPEEARDVPRGNLMMLTTGSQGEHRAATAQLSRGKYLGHELKEGDLFLFSSKTIPGNERSVGRIVNNFSEMGVEVVDDSDGLYHVSGHANRPDLMQMHATVDPAIVIPMHGEHRHLRAHAKLAEESGRKAVIAPNGTMVDLTGDSPRIVEYIEAGRTYLDGNVQIGALDGVVRDRIRMAMYGHVLVTVILDEDHEALGEPWCEIKGLPETGRSNSALVDVLEADLDQFIGRSDRKTRADDDKLDEAMRQVVRKSAQDEIGKKPEVTVVISRLS